MNYFFSCRPVCPIYCLRQPYRYMVRSFSKTDSNMRLLQILKFIRTHYLVNKYSRSSSLHILLYQILVCLLKTSKDIIIFPFVLCLLNLLTYFSRTFCLSSICTSKISVYFFLIFGKTFELLEFHAGLFFGRGHSFQELCFTFFKVTHRFLSLRHLIFCFSATIQNHTSNQTKRKVFQAWYLFLER